MPKLSRMMAGHPRTSFSLLVGLVLFFALPHGWAPSLRGILAWDGFGALFLLLSFIAFSGERLATMAQDAENQREGEWTIFAVTLAGVVASFAVIVQQFAQIKGSGGHAPLHVGLVAATLLLTWLVTHICFAFRYAHEYYETRPDGGIQGGLDFPGGEPPEYWDFLYFSLVLGMTFQVSDVQISARKLRRLATLHGFLGFAFNTVLLAFAVNLAAGLL